jgi:hypothetical protein
VASAEQGLGEDASHLADTDKDNGWCGFFHLVSVPLSLGVAAPRIT